MTIWGVLAGGQGRRYGGPKVVAMYHGRTFLDEVLERVASCREDGDRIVVSVAHGDPQGVAALFASSDHASAIEVCVDTIAGAGPAHAVGRLAGYAAKSGDSLVTVAVDQLRVTTNDLMALRDATKAKSDAISVACGSHGRHWVFAAIPPDLAGKVSRDAESVNSLQSLYLLNEIHDVPVSSHSLVDVNTPELLPPNS